jgi:NDP-sugar pyrophosphorylase family protein
MILPKPLVPVGERPVLDLLIRRLAASGFQSVELCLGHLGELIMAYFADERVRPEGMTFRYHREEEPLGTAGALRLLEGLTEPFLVMNGDIVTDLDFADLMAFHRTQDAALTIATTHKEVLLELGVLQLDDRRVVGFLEKPVERFSVSMGIYVYEPAVVERIPPGHFDFPDVVEMLLREGEHVVSYPFDGMWFDIGTPGDHERAVRALGLDAEAP